MAPKPKPGAVFVVSQLQDGQWHELLVTTHESTARAMLKNWATRAEWKCFHHRGRRNTTRHPRRRSFSDGRCYPGRSATTESPLKRGQAVGSAFR